MREFLNLPASQLPVRGAATMLGGALWIVYGFFEMLEPFGPAILYYEELGYELVTRAPLFLLYAMPGTIALLLTGIGLPALIALWHHRPGRAGRLAVGLAYGAAGTGLLSALGVVSLFVPLFFGGLVLGTFLLGGAALMLGTEGRRGALAVLGLIGLLQMPLRPLVYALALVPPAGAAAFIALFGLGWIVLGYYLWLAGRRPIGALSH